MLRQGGKCELWGYLKSPLGGHGSHTNTLKQFHSFFNLIRYGADGRVRHLIVRQFSRSLEWEVSICISLQRKPIPPSPKGGPRFLFRGRRATDNQMNQLTLWSNRDLPLFPALSSFQEFWRCGIL